MVLDIESMVRILRVRKKNRIPMVLVLGSRASHLFYSEEFYELVKELGHPSFVNLPPLERFTECYLLLTREKLLSTADIHSVLTRPLKSMKRTPADACLAELVKNGIFDIIITSIMDNKLEQALESASLSESNDFEVLSLHPGMAKEYMRISHDIQFHIIKVFGEVLSTRKHVMKRDGYFTQNKEIREFLEDFSRRDLMIIGLDQRWDAEIYRLFSSEGNSIWYINEEPLEDNDLFQIGTRNASYLDGEMGGYDRFFLELHARYFETAPDELGENNETNIVSLHQALLQLRDDVKKLREDVGYIREALKSGNKQDSGQHAS